jgi:hypothetical protein
MQERDTDGMAVVGSVVGGDLSLQPGRLLREIAPGLR